MRLGSWLSAYQLLPHLLWVAFSVARHILRPNPAQQARAQGPDGDIEMAEIGFKPRPAFKAFDVPACLEDSSDGGSRLTALVSICAAHRGTARFTPVSRQPCRPSPVFAAWLCSFTPGRPFAGLAPLPGESRRWPAPVV